MKKREWNKTECSREFGVERVEEEEVEEKKGVEFWRGGREGMGHTLWLGFW